MCAREMSSRRITSAWRGRAGLPWARLRRTATAQRVLDLGRGGQSAAGGGERGADCGGGDLKRLAVTWHTLGLCCVRRRLRLSRGRYGQSSAGRDHTIAVTPWGNASIQYKLSDYSRKRSRRELITRTHYRSSPIRQRPTRCFPAPLLICIRAPRWPIRSGRDRRRSWWLTFRSS